jgi:hypothetical protein
MTQTGETTVTSRTLPVLALLAALCLLLASCAPRHAALPQEETVRVRSIAILPAELVAEGRSSSPEEQAALETGLQTMNSLLVEHFAGRENIVLVTEEERNRLGADFLSCRPTAALAVCRAYQADAVLLLTLNRFRERDGGDYSVNSPASVAFDYRLIKGDTGQTLCSGVFNETQQPLLDDILLFFQRAKRGFKWLTAEALAREGLAQKLALCPYLQK